MKKYIFTESQLKKIIDSELGERSRSLAMTHKKRLFPKSAMDSNPDRFKEYDKEVKGIEESSPSPLKVSTTDGKYEIFAMGGFIKDNWGNTMCSKVAGFAQGIESLKKLEDGSVEIIAKGDFKESRILSPEDTKSLLFTLRQGKDWSTSSGGASITIGKSLVPFCKKEWGS